MTAIAAPPLYLDEATVQACLADAEIYAVVCETLTALGHGSAVNGPKAGFSVGEGAGVRHMGTVSGYLGNEDAAGMKWFMTVAENPGRRLPRVPATILLCDVDRGMLTGVLAASRLTSMRTSALAVACALRAAPTAPKKAAVIGAGMIGCEIARMLAAQSGVQEVALHSRVASSAQEACERIAASVSRPVNLTASARAEEAVANADLVFLATSVPQDASLVRASWLARGAVVCGAGSHREVDPSVIEHAAAIVVDDRQGTQKRGNLASSFQSGSLAPQRIAADAGELMSGAWTPPRDAQGPTLIALVGLGVLDVALASRAIANARRMGRGVPLEPGG